MSKIKVKRGPGLRADLYDEIEIKKAEVQLSEKKLSLLARRYPHIAAQFGLAKIPEGEETTASPVVRKPRAKKDPTATVAADYGLYPDGTPRPRRGRPPKNPTPVTA